MSKLSAILLYSDADEGQNMRRDGFTPTFELSDTDPYTIMDDLIFAFLNFALQQRREQRIGVARPE